MFGKWRPRTHFARRIGIGLFMGVAFSLGGTVPGATSALADPAPQSVYALVTCLDGPQHYVVPDGVSQLQIQAYGASGHSVPTASAGVGASVTATVPATPGEGLWVIAGCVGGQGFSPGGNGGHARPSGGNGGGSSGVCAGQTICDPAASPVLVVAGGGGGGGGGPDNTGQGGKGGHGSATGTPGHSGHGCVTNAAGGGGSAASGPAGNDGWTAQFGGGGGGGGGGYPLGGDGGRGGPLAGCGGGGGGGASYAAYGASNVQEVQAGASRV
jgi:hypothetical protein